MNVERQVYNKEVAKIIDIDANPEIKAMFDRAYELSTNLKRVEDRKEIHKLVDTILEYLFKDKVSTTFSVPIEFINGPIGRVLFTLKFGVTEEVYVTSEITAIMDITRALVSHDLDRKNLYGVKKGRNIIMYGRDLVAYMKSKNMSDDEIRERMTLYNQYKEEGLADEEIQLKIREIIKKK